MPPRNRVSIGLEQDPGHTDVIEKCLHLLNTSFVDIYRYSKLRFRVNTRQFQSPKTYRHALRCENIQLPEHYFNNADRAN